MSISSARFTETRFMVSDLIQRVSWDELFERCATNDMDQAKSIANIFSMFDPSHIWRFIDYVSKIPSDRRRANRDSTLVVSLIIGRIGQTNTSKSLDILRLFLGDDHMLRRPVEAALSNLWVLDTSKTQKRLLDYWIMKAGDNGDLQEVAVSSSEYLFSKEPERVKPFLKKILRSNDPSQKTSARAARELYLKYSNAKSLDRFAGKPHPRHKTKEKKFRKKTRKLGRGKRSKRKTRKNSKRHARKVKSKRSKNRRR